MKRNIPILLTALLCSAFLSSCAGNAAMRMVADALSSGTTGIAFTGDDDPELVGDALPFALKLYESLMEEVKDSPGLYLTSGSGFIMYSNAWVQGPADMLPDTRVEERKNQTARARKLYLRGRDYVLAGLELKRPGFRASLEGDGYVGFLNLMEKDDVPFLYWAAAGWLAAYAADPFDVELGVGARKARAMLETALRLDEAFDGGAIHDFFVTYYGALPAAMGGSEEKARSHFARAVELSRGLKASPYVSLASTVSVKNQNIREFRDLLNRALAIDVSARTGNRLANIIAQRKARWLLDHASDRFLTTGGKE
ncbi:MAG: TRAP transporter TatT component family protein [Spirochaetes bacterium]|nr:TRAP transporter TatT component family protein [Spirochaetota bacterium]